MTENRADDAIADAREVAERYLYDGETDQPLPGYDAVHSLADRAEWMQAEIGRLRDRIARAAAVCIAPEGRSGTRIVVAHQILAAAGVGGADQ